MIFIEQSDMGVTVQHAVFCLRATQLTTPQPTTGLVPGCWSALCLQITPEVVMAKG